MHNVILQNAGNEGFAEDASKFCDSRDGKKYVYKVIGNQTWMAENLNYATEESQCYYNCKYGRFYNKKAAMIACPNGWHLPSDKEWHWKMYAGDDLDRASSEDNEKIFSLYSVRCVQD